MSSGGSVTALPSTQEGSKGDYVEDISTRELLIEILTVLKKIEYHQYLATDAELKDQDV